jgi:thiol:disulfide interchange protein
VTVTGKEKLTAKVEYPQGELKKDEIVGDYKVYRGKVTIKATVQRAKDDDPLKVAVRVQTCSKSKCLLPSTLKVTAK